MNFWQLLKDRVAISKRSISFRSKRLSRDVKIDFYTPKHISSTGLPIIIFNDGQDLPRMNFKLHYRHALHAPPTRPFIVVAIHADHDRLRWYGTAGVLDYKGRGDFAEDYQYMITDELMPFLENLFQPPRDWTIAGFSLGGLSAFDLAWRQPMFDQVGAFSASFWWRDQPYNAQEEPDNGLIVPKIIEQTTKVNPMRFWFMAGTHDEAQDRNQNGVIDAIDDTVAVMNALRDKGYLMSKHIHYREVVNGTHDPKTWGQVMTEFLIWAFSE